MTFLEFILSIAGLLFVVLLPVIDIAIREENERQVKRQIEEFKRRK